MEKSKIAAVAAVFSFTVTAAVYALTDQRQRRARQAGRHVPYGPYEAVLKRPLDVLLAAGALIITAPVLPVLAAAVRCSMGAPVLFRQQRPGMDEKLFTLYKFRTMADRRDPAGALLPDEQRLTAPGIWLRATSLDELPELINIIRGDMSLVGPRPLLEEYLPRYSIRQHHRHDVRPGLTGLAQVSGRNLVSWEEKFEKDLAYTGHITFTGDLKIILRTAAAVLRREGISAPGSATAEVFTGSERQAGKS